ncbi:14.7 kDa ribonuclease H-like protein [Telopea speciosissima]|uniref:14.7 kDa ribonuclease H-like protein n=1 Tax=Telopea speciosissima TaxID=54955 RepID=UPI001CC69693|nr:14.7 kDa ribonuclease H-like protein [Telopea speciosissima]
MDAGNSPTKIQCSSHKLQRRAGNSSAEDAGPHTKSRLPRPIYWCPPRRGVKMNVDGASKGNPGPSGGGRIIRNQEGNLIMAFSNFYGCCTNTEAELRAMLDGLRHCERLGLVECQVSSDSNTIVQYINAKKCEAWRCWYWFEEVIHLVEALQATVSFSFRESNRAADYLANWACSSQRNSTFWPQGELPSKLFSIIREDKAGLPVFRF